MIHLLLVFISFTIVSSVPPQTEKNAICELANLCNNFTICFEYAARIGCDANETTITYLAQTQQGLKIPFSSSIGSLRNTTYIVLDRMKFIGSIPQELFGLTKLNHLALYGNELNGTIPTQFGNLTSLKYLSLGQNLFTGTIPTQFGYLVNLTFLYVRENYLNGTIPTQMLKLVNLKDLDVDNSLKCPNITISYKPNEGFLKRCGGNIQIKVDEEISLNGTISLTNMTTTNGSTLTGEDLDLSTQTLELSPNTKVQLTNSIISVSGNTTISSLNLILDNENRNQPAISTKGCLNIQPNTELNVTFSKGLPQTNQNLFSFACKTGNFSRVQVNGQTACDFVLSSNFATVLPCTGTGSGEEKTIFSFVVLLFIQIIAFYYS